MEGDLDNEDLRKLIQLHFKEKSFVYQQIYSYDTFIRDTLQQVVNESSSIIVTSDQTTYQIDFGQIEVLKPSWTESDGSYEALYPKDARLRNLTYAADLHLMVKETLKRRRNGEEVLLKSESKNYIGKVPVMIRSSRCSLYDEDENKLAELGECHGDPGGYFIVNGIERFLISQDRVDPLCMLVSRTGIEVHSMTKTHNKPCKMFVHMRSSKGNSSRQCLRVALPCIKTEIPIYIIFRALNVDRDGDIKILCCHTTRQNSTVVNVDKEMAEMLRPSWEESSCIMTKESALDYIGRRGACGVTSRANRISYAEDILKKYMLPHLERHQKVYNLGYVVRRLLLCALGRINEDQRNHYANKRIYLAGSLLGDLFSKLFRKLCKDTKNYLQKCVEDGKDCDLKYAIQAKTITGGFEYSLSTGNWETVCGAYGPSHVLHRLNYLATLSQLRRLKSPTGYLGNQTEPRHLHASHWGLIWGLICPTETPEGNACGLIKNMAVMACITVGSSTSSILEILRQKDMLNVDEVALEQIFKVTKVFLNRRWIGIHQHIHASKLMQDLRHLRRQGIICSDIGLSCDFHLNELHIFADHGRCCRPLVVDEEHQRLVIKKENIKALAEKNIKWDDFVGQGLLEYIDASEEEIAMISMTLEDLYREKPSESYPMYTHCEIHPALILGICASTIPFSNHNQSVRNTKQSAICKQSIGTYLTNYLSRMDKSAHILFYPQRPLVTTMVMNQLNADLYPFGTNAIIAIASYTGYNQEDSVIINQSSIDRGIFRSFLFRSYSDVERKKGSLVNEQFCRPNKATTMGIGTGSYDNLEADGLPPPGTCILRDDVIIGKTCIISEGNTSRYMHRDLSTSAHPNERGIIDRVMLTTNADGLKLVKVRVRSVRIPEIGDKLSSSHAQKGTIGMSYSQEDMPWTVQGITPDLIINPHSLPTRMTVSQFMECISAKTAAMIGKFGDGTPFDNITVDKLAKALKDCDYQGQGLERMYNGHTGKSLEALIFIGPAYYQRLKHMVDDKVYARPRGPVQILTRQPTEGRSRYGGIRFGEMERDCLISHGAALSLREKMHDLSDSYLVHVCTNCGLIGVARTRFVVCKNCKEDSCFQVKVPYAWKLLCQELMSMGIAPRMVPEERATITHI